MRLQQKRTAVLALMLLAMACGGNPPPTLGPSGRAAYYSTRAVKVLDVVRDIAIAGNEQQPPLISTDDTRTVVLWHQAALRVIRATPDGWRATVTATTDQVKQKLSAETRKELEPYFSLLTVILKEVV